MCKSDSLPEKMQCRICDAPATFLFDDRRSFYICSRCGLIFCEGILSVEEEQRHYQDQYVHEFDWSTRAQIILKFARLAVEPRKIMDYGSGSGRLSGALSSRGFDVDSYEPMLHGDFNTDNYDADYDLVILHEVFEHLEDILKTLDNVFSITKPGGIIFISTLMTDEIIDTPDRFQELFRTWWYKDDPTHVSFYCSLTFEYICTMKSRYQLQLVDVNSNCVTLQKSVTEQAA